VIENDEWSITINGSANYTNNPRIEAGCIIPLKASAEFHRKWILELLEKGEPFE
jgi:hypothetical protein